ncbi:hypothetical protein BcepSauron_025 [Burkholderia phage BcepSauron]|uniref:Uncharacterized protein n=2 Tax=Sarumanvirus TaxID=2843450 RepID=A0A482MLC0_9CAUD|nr:hypothetical protein H1O16_gp024 [Burkholderia phage BcepSaruman]YP_009904403.1 hypothetical protein H1O17_gp025 [Burkholderia phage BcepSauron]QBQ74405.1 hypothetical protein BcepSauron_025 [Burkholderia phage BcepSauron]QBX06437.1 hypothetical protein BcepSaruman_024 [Burkholderia phage BcepSaruman]
MTDATNTNAAQNDLTPEEIAMLRGLKARGYAVILFTADELHGMDAEDAEDRIIGLANDYVLGQFADDDSAGDDGTEHDDSDTQ